MWADPLQLARLNFATTLTFHFLFVVLTLGLVTLVAILQTRWVRTGDPVFERMTKFWGLIYVVNYVLGIATGLVNELQFGLHWTGLVSFAGNVFGSALALETLVAFVAEATFLGMWIFGWNRLPKRLHLTLIWLVAATAYASAFWVMVANAFLQRPGGYELRDGRAYLTDFGALVGNSNLWIALAHVLAAALAAGGFFVAGVSAWHFLRRTTEVDLFRRSMKTGLVTAWLASLVTVATGVLQFDEVIGDQPVKAAVLIGEHEELERYRAALEQRFGEDIALPPVEPLAYAADIMMFSGLAMVLLSSVALLMLRRDRLLRRRIVLRLLVGAIALPFVAVIAGWVLREVGRQPWAVYDVLRTSDALSPTARPGPILASLLVFGALYLVLAVVDYLLIARIVRHGPDVEAWQPEREPDPDGTEPDHRPAYH